MERADDQAALTALARVPEVSERASTKDAIELLWSVCCVPDFRGLLLDAHIELLSEVFLQLTGPRERLDAEWLESHVKRFSDLQGDIDTLLMRMAAIRTFTYMAHQKAWVPDAELWQERTKASEDALSDALHRLLVARFVNGNRSVTRSVRPRSAAPRAHAEPENGGGIESPFAKLAGLRDLLARRDTGRGDPIPAGEEAWLEALIDAAHGRFRMDDRGKIYDGAVPIGRLNKGKDWLCPEVTITLDDVGSGARSRVQRRLVAWTRDLVADMLAPLRHESLEALSPAARGLVYQLERSLGTATGASARAAASTLTRQDRRLLHRTGLRISRPVAYLPALLSRDAVVNRVALWRAFHGSAPDVPASASFVIGPGVDHAACTAVGYPVLGPRAVRADVVARLAAILRDEQGRSAEPFILPTSVADCVECSSKELPAVLRALGYRSAGGERFVRAGRRRKRRAERAVISESEHDS
jgi:ATP-dependent RNA helicase SUPV3L1/SUV3